MKNFITGLELSELLYKEVVQPILKIKFPKLTYGAALLGSGSEVLGFDDHVSRDHHWGPRLQLFLKKKDYQTNVNTLKKVFSKELPYTFRGYSTNWSAPDPEDSMNQFLVSITEGPINHRIEIFTVQSYLQNSLAIDSLNLSDVDWLLLPEQGLREFISGKVFHDSAGELTQARKTLQYYPDNVWRFKLLAEWEHIGQELAFVGRTGSRGDDLGSRLESTRLVRYIMRLSYLLHKKYPLYPKWFAMGFRELPISTKLEPTLLRILKEERWRKREEYLCEAYLILLEIQNKLRITPKITLEPVSYFNRDQLVIDIGEITKNLQKTIQPPLNKIRYPIGSVNQFIDDTYILTDAHYVQKAHMFYENVEK